MTELFELLKMPIPSIAGILILWALAERTGLPITRIVSSMLKLNGHKKEESVPEWAAQLKTHFNDTTTSLLQKLVDKSEKSCAKLDTIIRNQEEDKDDSEEWRRESRETMRDLMRKV